MSMLKFQCQCKNFEKFIMSISKFQIQCKCKNFKKANVKISKKQMSKFQKVKYQNLVYWGPKAGITLLISLVPHAD